MSGMAWSCWQFHTVSSAWFIQTSHDLSPCCLQQYKCGAKKSMAVLAVSIAAGLASCSTLSLPLPFWLSLKLLTPAALQVYLHACTWAWGWGVGVRGVGLTKGSADCVATATRLQ